MGLLLAIIVAGWRRWWVFGWQYDALAKDRDQWKNLALEGTDLAERAARSPLPGG